MTPEQVANISDPERRAVAAQAAIKAGNDRLDRLRKLRDDAIGDLRVAGWTQTQIVDLVGVSSARVAAIDRAQGIVTERTRRRQ
jgi:hypothetical protein